MCEFTALKLITFLTKGCDCLPLTFQLYDHIGEDMKRLKNKNPSVWFALMFVFNINSFFCTESFLFL